MRHIEELEQLAIKYAQAYYEGQELVSDAVFDALIEEIRHINPNSDVLGKVGWGYCVDDRKKVAHIGATVGSLSKVKYPEQVDTQGKIISCKLDGGSIVLYYTDGKLTEALTRGDGKQGMSCLNKMRHLLKGIKIPMKGLVSIRGEALIPNENHQTLIDRGIPNPRNYANGIINRIDAGDDINLLCFVPYSIRVADRPFSKLEMLDSLSDWGFRPLPYTLGSSDISSDCLKALYEDWSKIYPIDGVVISDHEPQVSKDSDLFVFSETAIAYKFETECAQAIVGGVDWQVGEVGKVIPVIKLKDSVFLTGANISSITAHHANNVLEKQIGVGATITFERANEVIPHLVSVDIPAQPSLPTECPVCGIALSWKGLDLVCCNQMCKAKQDAKIRAMFELCGIPDGFGDVFFDQYVQDRNIYQIATMARSGRLESLYVDSHFARLAKVLTDNVNAKFLEGFSFEEFWKMARIAGLGTAASKKLRDTDPCTFLTLQSSSLIAETGSKLKLPVNVIESMLDSYSMWVRLAKVIPFKVATSKTYKMQVVVTGAVSMPRKEFEKFLEDNDIELKPAITKDIDYLICNEGDSGSTKTKKAKALGIKIMNESAFLSMLGLDD